MEEHMDEELSAAAAIAWDQTLLAPIIEINERMLEQLHATARAASAASVVDEVPDLVRCLLQEWCVLDAAAQRRLAQCPYLLLDAGFDDAARWQASRPLTVQEAGRALPRGDALWRSAAWLALARRTLLLGWHLARAQPLAARVLLCMSAPSAEAIAARRLTDLDELAVQEAGRIAPHWLRQPQVWRQLLHASHHSAQQLRSTQLRGLQLLAATRSGRVAGTGA
jgi:hypothetical protein